MSARPSPAHPSSPSGPPPADGAALAPGTRLQEYEVQRVLGGGGFGITYLARDAHLDLPVAIKEYFPADLLTRAPDGRVLPRSGDVEALHRFRQGLQRFVDEARALATFRHPHIVRVLRYFRAHGTACIVMEYEPGLSLKRWLPRQGALGQDGLLAILLPLLDGVGAVHAAGFLHRDIKPDNIVVREDGAPVLLDFGAARRLTPQGELTHIVSPGFSPFEQYHGQGAQGPWTDLYSLGAVMYWMVTGQRPLEAAARVPSDPLVPALRAAEGTAFGAPLLRAIDWALRPEPQQRPQSVAQLREALQGDARTVPVDPRRRGAFAPAGASAPTGNDAFEALASFDTPSRRNLLCTILFMDLVGYTARSVDDQVAIKGRLNDLVTRTLREAPPEGRLAIDTGDGAALCFLGDPEAALQAALRIREQLGRHGGPPVAVRMGLHLGPVRVVTDVNERTNVIGDGINVAQRIMTLARPGQVLASRAYHDVISRITDDTAGLFRYIGPRPDKHGRLHEVHAVTLPAPPVADAASQPLTSRPTSPAALVALEQALCRHLGPMARVLLRQQLDTRCDNDTLVAALCAQIDAPAAREEFRQLALRLLRQAG